MKIDEFITITKALSDPQRIRALMALRKGELCVCQVIELLQLAPSTVSKHMSILKQARLVQSRKDSRWVYYSLPKNHNKKEELGLILNATLKLLDQDLEITNDLVTLESITAADPELLCRNQRC